MSPPIATGDTTPAAKRLKLTTAAAVTPMSVTQQSDFFRAFARIQADSEAAAAAEADANAADDTEMEDDKDEEGVLQIFLER